MPDLAPLATVDDLAERAGRDLTQAEQDRAATLLASASSKVRRFCRRDFSPVTGDVLRIKPIGDKVILPNAPATAVTSVKRINYDGTKTALAGWAWDGGDTVYVDSVGSPMINAPEEWSDDPYIPLVEVTWDHGDAVSVDLVDIVCAMTMRVLNNSSGVEGVLSETAGPFAIRRNDPAPGGSPKLSNDDKQQLRDLGYASASAATTVQLR
jgi:hypothetical protein